MRAIFYFVAICTAFLTATVVYRYASYKVAVGPEEDRNEFLVRLGSVGGMAYCRTENAEVWIVRMLAVALWSLDLYVLKESWLFLLYGLCISLLLGLSYVDIKINELPPQMNILIAVLGIIRMAMDLEHWYLYIIGAVSVSGVLLLIGLLSSGKAMGGGDVKLMAALGLLLGWQKIILVFMLGAVLGAVLHGCRMLICKEGHTLAFGPYLAAGSVVAMLWGDKLITAYLNLFFKA